MELVIETVFLLKKTRDGENCLMGKWVAFICGQLLFSSPVLDYWVNLGILIIFFQENLCDWFYLLLFFSKILSEAKIGKPIGDW